MSTFSIKLPDNPIATFSILSLEDQIYPEIDPEFVEQHLKKLKKKWHVINYLEYPLIRKGWNDFKAGNNLPNDVEKLPSTFASYLKENDMKDILLCGDHGNKLDFTVMNMADPTNTCLAYDWKYFSSLNFCKPGDIIRFKFNLYDINGKCHVYKLSN
ncbi:hypothetical protein P8452_41830 [Trifolium repens]|nr:hypothetical protein P8452_41830 [Trifolium repens]